MQRICRQQFDDRVSSRLNVARDFAQVLGELRRHQHSAHKHGRRHRSAWSEVIRLSFPARVSRSDFLRPARNSSL